MKLTNVFAILMTAVVMMIWITGCCSIAPKPVTTVKGDLQFTEEITATVTADQAIVMDGKKFKVADVPAQLIKKNTSKYITIIVYPESKMVRETLVDLIKTLVQNKFNVVIGANSKYADVPIPRS